MNDEPIPSSTDQLEIVGSREELGLQREHVVESVCDTRGGGGMGSPGVRWDHQGWDGVTRGGMGSSGVGWGHQGWDGIIRGEVGSSGCYEIITFVRDIN